MKKETLFFVAIIVLIVGTTFIGWGIGRIFKDPWDGIILGMGCGLTVSSIKFFKLSRWMYALNKE